MSPRTFLSNMRRGVHSSSICSYRFVIPAAQTLAAEFTTTMPFTVEGSTQRENRRLSFSYHMFHCAAMSQDEGIAQVWRLWREWKQQPQSNYN